MTKVYHSDAFCLDGEAHYVADIGIAAIYRQPAVHLHADWCVNRWGRVIVTLDAHKDMAMPPLPRLGIMLPVERSMRHVTYYGYGPDESYIDKREHCYVDMFQAEVEDLHENYIRPQENGSHYHCRYVSLENENTVCLRRQIIIWILTFRITRWKNWQEKGIILNWNRRLVPYCRWMRG